MTDDEFFTAMMGALPRARAYARSLAGDRALADDLVQETLTRAWANRARFVPGTNMEAWLVTILRNTFLSDRRKRAREIEDPDGDYASSLSVGPAQTSTVELHETLRALQRLPLDQREALLLVAASGFSYEEAAQICGTAEGTMKSRVFRARARLQALLADEDLHAHERT